MKNHEKLYKESLDKIQEVLNNAKKQGHIVVRVEDLENTFHELKETEDERIRNAISYAIGNSTHEDGTLINGVTESEAMAWLKKQGEQKLVNSAKTCKDEQKPYGQMEECLDCQFNYAGECKGSCAMKRGEQNPAWSEEDERMCNASIRACQYMVENFENSTWDYEDAIDWLKSLKNKVQPKQEWSEEDKGNLLDVKCIIDEIWHCQYIRGEIDRSCEELESLWSWLDNIWQKLEYPSSTWKPSEEQIRALEYQVHSTYQGSWQYKASKELLEQLKKL